MLHFYTTQIKKGQKIDTRVMDITISDGNKVFAPSWPMVKGLRSKTITWEQYREMYYNRMRKSYKEHRLDWDMLLGQNEVIIGCFCHKNANCHRFILTEILQKLGALYEGELEN